jgi:uncharacterized protein YdeI (BOF family)
LANAVLLFWSGKSATFQLTEKNKTMKRTSLILIGVFAMVMLPAAFGQGTPSQSQDPTTHSPITQHPRRNPSTNDPSSSASSSSDTLHNFIGSIVKHGGTYMLHTGDADYQLNDQAQASKFEGQEVKVTGQVDRDSDTIRVQSIELASSM